MIHAGLVLATMAWSAVEAGKITYINTKRWQEQSARDRERRKQLEFFAPLNQWWTQYGSNKEETERQYYRVSSDRYETPGVDMVRRLVTPQNAYIEGLLKTPTKYPYRGYPYLMLYYACLGKAAWVRCTVTNDLACNIPSANLFYRQRSELQEAIVWLLEAKNVPDIYWYTEHSDDIIRRLQGL